MSKDKCPACDGRRLFKRSAQNPLLTADDWPYPVNTVFNAGAIRLQDGQTLLLARCEDLRGLSHLCAVRSEDGVTDWRIDQEPTFAPDVENYPEEIWGIEDPRITWIPDQQEYAIAYTAYSLGGPGVSLAFTSDFKKLRRTGMVMSPDDKDAALFPRRFDGRWVLIHRPVAPNRAAHIWISYSPDLKHWGDSHILLEARQGAWWDARKIGLCTPPLETAEGWLIFYHGVRETAHGSLYRLGAALIDLEDPRRVRLRGRPVAVRPRDGLRARRRRGRRRLPLRPDPRRRRRHAAPLLRRRRHQHLPGHRQPEGSAGVVEGMRAATRKGAVRRV